MRKNFAAVARRRASGEAKKERDQNLRSRRPGGRAWQIQKKLAAMIRRRARSSLARSVAGWLAEWLGVRASGIMGIEDGLSNFSVPFD
ncbi:hypothetical protein RRSWK_03640 [Rhodopirellula sp. SWK7]|nr:hypothetical protein RRSWK_03640 [Rhodopirellula sp. SWK7]